MKTACLEIWMLTPKSPAVLAGSGALLSALENPRANLYLCPEPYSYPQQVSKVNSL
jgi:hypothetical protein